MTLLIFLINAFYYREGLGRLVAMPEKKAKKKAPKKIVIRGKRPRDPNQLAKWIVDRSTIEPTEELIVPDKPAKP